MVWREEENEGGERRNNFIKHIICPSSLCLVTSVYSCVQQFYNYAAAQAHFLEARVAYVCVF